MFSNEWIEDESDLFPENRESAGFDHHKEVTCPRCEGTGNHFSGGDCPYCEGLGSYIPSESSPF